LTGRLRQLQRLHIGVGGDKLHAFHVGLDHAVDGVAAAAAHADYLDARSAHIFVVKLNAHLTGFADSLFHWVSALLDFYLFPHRFRPHSATVFLIPVL
jgi:hypothetical protein